MLEPFEDSFWRRSAVQPANLAVLRTRDALAEVPGVPGKVVSVFESKATVVPRPEVPRAIKPEHEPGLAESLPEAVRLEVSDMTELKDKIPIAELEHQTAVAEVPEVPRLEVPGFPTKPRWWNLR